MSGTVLLLDGRALSCLAFARRLARDGMEVHVGESFKHNITAYSNSTAKTHTYPSPSERPDAFKRSVSELIERVEYDFVVPIRDATTTQLAELQEELPASTRTLLDTPENIERLRDKERCAKLAERTDVPIPNTYYPSEQGIDEIRSEADFPVLVKPTHESGARGIRRVETPEDLDAAYRATKRSGSKAIVQEFVDHAGGHFSIGTVFDRRSRPRAVHVYEELIQYPNSGGPAIRAVSVDVEPWVHEMLAILEAVDWTGPAHMDVLFDPADETFKLLEVNPRIWMSVALTIEAGVDIPKIMLDTANGIESDEPNRYDTDLAYRWVVPNEILWAIDGRETALRFRRLLEPDGRSTCFGILDRNDPSASLGAVLQSLEFLLHEDKRAQIFDRGTQ